jgi:hypothetical protein
MDFIFSSEDNMSSLGMTFSFLKKILFNGNFSAADFKDQIRELNTSSSVSILKALMELYFFNKFNTQENISQGNFKS